ncbi:MAG: hypothetical protein N2B06_16325 [Clostridium sp.]
MSKSCCCESKNECCGNGGYGGYGGTGFGSIWIIILIIIICCNGNGFGNGF